MWTVWGPYLEKKYMTEARRAEIEAQKAQVKAPKPRRHLWNVIAPTLIFAVPILFIVDGLVFPIGLLYSPYLSFFNPLDTPIQVAGGLLAAVGLVLMFVVGRTLIFQVFSKASEEREMMTTGIYAYIRHPFYLSFFLIPIGMFLITLNVVGLLFLLPFLFTTDSDLEACGRKGKLTFLLKAIDCEEVALIQKYGGAYEEYRARTGRLLPRIRR